MYPGEPHLELNREIIRRLWLRGRAIPELLRSLPMARAARPAAQAFLRCHLLRRPVPRPSGFFSITLLLFTCLFGVPLSCGV